MGLNYKELLKVVTQKNLLRLFKFLSVVNIDMKSKSKGLLPVAAKY